MAFSVFGFQIHRLILQLKLRTKSIKIWCLITRKYVTVCVHKAGGRTICLDIHKLITYIWKNEKLPEEWKESTIVPIHKKGDKTDCSNYRGISLLPTTYKLLSNIVLSRLIPYAKEIIEDHQCGFRRNRSTIDLYSAFAKYLRKNGNKLNQFISFYRLQESFRFS